MAYSSSTVSSIQVKTLNLISHITQEGIKGCSIGQENFAEKNLSTVYLNLSFVINFTRYILKLEERSISKDELKYSLSLKRA